MMIPALIHQTYPTDDLPPLLRENVARIRAINPRFEHRLYDDVAIRRFLQQEYGADVLTRFDRIGNDYGAARADFFRYFLLYRLGGVYLDIKSTTTVPLDDVLGAGDVYILSQWRNGPNELHAAWGLYKEVADIPGGEFQQWFIACAPGHPFLRAVTQRVLENIDRYSSWTHGVGKNGVLRTTGPLTYTRAIHPLLSSAPHRRVANETALGLSYTIMAAQYDHVTAFKTHYSDRHTPVVRPASWSSAVSALLYTQAHKTVFGRGLPLLRRLKSKMASRSAQGG